MWVERLGTSLDDGMEILSIHTEKYNSDGDEIQEFKQCKPEELPAIIKIYEEGNKLNEDGSVNMSYKTEDFLGNQVEATEQVSVATYQKINKIEKGENRVRTVTIVQSGISLYD